MRPFPGLALSRRSFLAWTAGFAAYLAWGPGPADTAVTAPSAPAIRDHAVDLLRKTDITPPWFISGSWVNRHYDPWTDYLSGRIPEARFEQECLPASDYCLHDVWNLTKRLPEPIDWDNDPPLNWSAIHALALRFFRTGEAIYLDKWLAVVADFAAWCAARPPRQDHPIDSGNPAALLHLAFAWGGIFTALAIVAKGLPADTGHSGRATASAWAPTEVALAPGQYDALDADRVAALVGVFLNRDAPRLLKFYARPNYVPNQRMYGLEAVAQAVAFFPEAEGAPPLTPALNRGLSDVVSRYRLPDGGQLEQSFNYAEDLVFGAMRTAALPFPRPPDWLGQAQQTVIGWLRLAAALETPIGGLPQVGNAVWKPRPEHEAGTVRDALTNTRFASTSIAFPYSGLYAMRSSWQPDAAYLFFFYRRVARGHSMAACNSIQVAAYGRQLLIAGGSANYSGKSKFPTSVPYLAETSSFKANTVLVDDRSQCCGAPLGLPKGADGKADLTLAPATPLPSRWLSAPNFDYVDGLYYEGYQGGPDGSDTTLVKDVGHFRQVVFVRPLLLWVVIDTLLTRGAHNYTQIWKFAAPYNGFPTKGFAKDQVVLQAAARTIRTEDDGPDAVNLSIQQFGCDPLTYGSFFGEGAYGWMGPSPSAAAVKATDVHVTWRGEGPQVLITLITPYRGRQSPIAEVTGTSAPARADFKARTSDGVLLSVEASVTPGTGTSAGTNGSGTALLLELDRPGSVRSGIRLTPAEGYAFDGEARSPILAPGGFDWTVRSGGELAPSYRYPEADRAWGHHLADPDL